MKTPEELAEEYADTQHYDVDQEWSDSYRGFLAGYQAAAPQWISVKDRLPEDSSFVVVWCCKQLPLEVGNILMLAKFERPNWRDQPTWLVVNGFDRHLKDGEYYSCIVTHWMPLPAPPKEEK